MKKALLSCCIFLFFCSFPHKSFAADKMSVHLLNDRLKIGGDFYIRFETRSDYYTQNGRFTGDHGISSRQRLSFDFTPKKDMGIMLTFLKTVDWNDSHPYLFPYAYDHGTDIQQGYIHLNKPMGIPFSMWAGRKEVAYLNQRLIGHSYGWTNKPINFDGTGISFEWNHIKADAFYLNKVRRNLDNGTPFNNDWFDNPSDLYGLWITFKDIPVAGKIETYTLINDDDNGSDSVTPGIRIYGKRGSFDYDINLTLQFGHKYINGEKLERHAQAFYFDSGYTFDMPQKPRIALQYNYASGDDNPNDHSYHTFDQLYGCVHGKYGLMDFFSWQNMHDVYLYSNANLIKDMKVLVGFHSFWLADTHDAWYNCYKKIQRRDTSGNADSFVGNELDLLVSYRLFNNFKITGFYGHFFAGSYIEDTGKARDADYSYCQIEYRF